MATGEKSQAPGTMLTRIAIVNISRARRKEPVETPVPPNGSHARFAMVWKGGNPAARARSRCAVGVLAQTFRGLGLFILAGI